MHFVAAGETPATIAAAYGVPARELVACNLAHKTWTLLADGQATFVQLREGEPLLLPGEVDADQVAGLLGFLDDVSARMPARALAVLEDGLRAVHEARELPIELDAAHEHLTRAVDRTLRALGLIGDGLPQNYAATIYTEQYVLADASGSLYRLDTSQAPTTLEGLKGACVTLAANYAAAQSASVADYQAAASHNAAAAFLDVFKAVLNAFVPGLGDTVISAGKDLEKAVGDATATDAIPPVAIPPSWQKQFGTPPAPTNTFDSLAYTAIMKQWDVNNALPPCQSIPCPQSFVALQTPLLLDFLINSHNLAHPVGGDWVATSYKRTWKVTSMTAGGEFGGQTIPPSPVFTGPNDPIALTMGADGAVEGGNFTIHGSREWKVGDSFSKEYVVHAKRPAPPSSGGGASAAGAVAVTGGLLAAVLGGLWLYFGRPATVAAFKHAWRTA